MKSGLAHSILALAFVLAMITLRVLFLAIPIVLIVGVCKFLFF